ncbi:hypothetical protein O6H91_09G086100 [Diphasiastrum complanatum]|uniref:Uncharacterized protein n=1 Tax=Diphasiastrum complanatum TaxID=34168 RepID=A0ACC2CRC4_DIPCM|nr:hypothetical protein O6H91_09G086100 [Diphasiastrum complanatum]
MASESSNGAEKGRESSILEQERQKWDACYDLAIRRFVYSSAVGSFAGLLLFRSPVTRWSTIAFAAGMGLGSAYTDCSHILQGPISNLTDASKTSASS